MLHDGMVYRASGREEFLVALRAAKVSRGDLGLCVSEPEPSASLFISADGLSGYALSGPYREGFGSVFSAAKGRLSGMVRDAEQRTLRAGGWFLTLDCFEPLAAVYARDGFMETGRVAFDWAYAPDGWRGRHGAPDVVFMQRPVAVHIAA